MYIYATVQGGIDSLKKCNISSDHCMSINVILKVLALIGNGGWREWVVVGGGGGGAPLEL